jgi:hypothetical protein
VSPASEALRDLGKRQLGELPAEPHGFVPGERETGEAPVPLDLFGRAITMSRDQIYDGIRA